MKMNPIILNEDCKETLDRKIHYDYVITSPPDFAEIGIKPSVEIWFQFLNERLKSCKPHSNLITIFVSDRRFQGHTIPKDYVMHNLFGMENLLSHKIWVKSYKTNLYRPNFTHILTYSLGTKHRKTIPMPDVFFDEFHPVGDYSYNFSLDIVKKYILAYTDTNDTVFDPFIGSGTTALACLQTGRYCIGTELNPETYDLCMTRIANEQTTAREMVEETWSAPRPIEGAQIKEKFNLEIFYGNS